VLGDVFGAGYIAQNADFYVLLNIVGVILPCLFIVHSRNKPRKVIIPDKSCCWLSLDLEALDRETRQHFRQAPEGVFRVESKIIYLK